MQTQRFDTFFKPLGSVDELGFRVALRKGATSDLRVMRYKALPFLPPAPDDCPEPIEVSMVCAWYPQHGDAFVFSSSLRLPGEAGDPEYIRVTLGTLLTHLRIQPASAVGDRLIVATEDAQVDVVGPPGFVESTVLEWTQTSAD